MNKKFNVFAIVVMLMMVFAPISKAESNTCPANDVCGEYVLVEKCSNTQYPPTIKQFTAYLKDVDGNLFTRHPFVFQYKSGNANVYEAVMHHLNPNHQYMVEVLYGTQYITDWSEEQNPPFGFAAALSHTCAIVFMPIIKQ